VPLAGILTPQKPRRARGALTVEVDRGVLATVTAATDAPSVLENATRQTDCPAFTCDGSQRGHGMR